MQTSALRAFIRVDSSEKIGSGHLMRCLVLAKHLSRSGFSVAFIMRDLPGSSSHMVQSGGYGLHKLAYNRSNMCDSSQLDELYSVAENNDANESLSILKAYLPVTLIVIDHYALDFEWENAMKPYVKLIMTIDDLANRKHACDILLDQNYHHRMRHRYDPLVPKKCIQFLGPSYALLRDEFMSNRPSHVKYIRCVKNILVSFGGHDPKNYCYLLATIIFNHQSDFAPFEFTFILNDNHAKRKDINRFIRCLPNASCVGYTDSMSSYIKNCDLFIGSPGVTSLERMAMGVPALVAISSNNQKEIARQGHGTYHHIVDLFSERAHADLTNLFGDIQYLNMLASNAYQIMSNQPHNLAAMLSTLINDSVLT